MLKQVVSIATSERDLIINYFLSTEGFWTILSILGHLPPPPPKKLFNPVPE